MKEEITNKDLKEFCEWFADFHGTDTTPSVFTTCMCGHFRTYTKASAQLLKRCKVLGLVASKGEGLAIVHAIGKGGTKGGTKGGDKRG